MRTKEDIARKAIKAKFGSVPKMSKATGIPATTIYHALDRGLDNTTTRIRTQIESALFEVPKHGDSVQHDELTDDEREILACYRALSAKGKRAVLAGLKDYASKQ